MKTSPQRVLALWVTRVLLAGIAITLLTLWVRAEFQFTPSRGGAKAAPFVHLYFVGVAGLALIGLLCTFISKLQRASAIICIISSGLLWTSCVLVMIRVVPPWFSLGLSILVMTIPITLGLILLTPRASATYHNFLFAFSTFALLALLVIALKPPWHLQVLANTRVLDGQVTFWNEHHQTSHATLLGRFRFDFMLWSLSGYPPHREINEVERRREDLVLLGYFQKRTIPLEGVRLHHVTPNLEKIPTRDALWTILHSPDSETVIIYACNADMPVIEAVFAQAKQQHKMRTLPRPTK